MRLTVAQRVTSVVLGAIVAALIGAASASASSTVLSQNWESGIGSWTATGFWHVQTHPETIAVKSPDINPDLVTLPDSGSLPSAYEGTNVAWYGQASTGTYCGSDFATVTQSPKDGCTSNGANSGTLTSPSFSLSGAASAIMRFAAWWEVEGVEANGFDLMNVEYSIDGGSTWNQAGTLSPANNPQGKADQPYSNNGLGASPSWKQYLVDLSPAAGQSNVQVRFNFATGDQLYNGFRGWLVDAISIDTPFDAGAPQISSVGTCSGPSQPAPVWAVNGQNFVEGSQVLLDGAQDTAAAIEASDRIEIPATTLGQHTVEVVSPNKTTSNTFSFSADNCNSPGQVANGSGKRPTATQVGCNFIIETLSDTCTATVGDAAAPPRSAPTGPVSFSSAGDLGVFSAGKTCNLVSTPLSPGVASCSVQYVPPTNGPLPTISALYAGDTTHAPSGGGSGFILASVDGSGDACNAATPAVARMGVPPLRAAAGGRSARAGAIRAALNQYSYPNSSSSFGDTMGYYASLCARTVQTGVGRAVQAGGVLLGGGIITAGVLAPDPEPASKTGLVVGSVALGGFVAGTGVYTGQQIVNSANSAIQDPPDRHYRQIAKPRRPRKVTVHAGKGLTPAAASALQTLITTELRAGSLASAMRISLDRAGGARRAHNGKWQGRQMTAAVGDARQLAGLCGAIVPEIQNAATFASQSATLRRATPARNLTRFEREARHRMPIRMAHLLETLGASRADLSAIRRAAQRASLKQVPVSVAALLQGTQLTTAYRETARALLFFVADPQIVAQTQLR